MISFIFYIAMFSRQRKQQSSEIVKLRKELEYARKKITNLSQQINTLLRERDRFWSPRLSSSVSDKTTVDWRGKLEEEKKTTAGHAQSQTDLENQVQSINLNRGRWKKRNITTVTSMDPYASFVISDFPPTCPVKDVSQIILPYENAMKVAGTVPAVAVSPIRPAQIIYNCQPQTPTRFIPRGQHCFEGQLPIAPEHYVVSSRVSFS